MVFDAVCVSKPYTVCPHDLQGLLEMMHERMSEWVAEFVNDIAALSPQLTLPTPIRYEAHKIMHFTLFSCACLYLWLMNTVAQCATLGEACSGVTG